MALPQELQNMVIAFCPYSSLLTVCKDWNTEVKNIQKKAVATIGSWYKKVHVIPDIYVSVKNMVRNFVLYYPKNFFIEYPEFTVHKLDLNYEILTIIPPIEYRKRSDVRDWMLNMTIDLDDWLYVGW